MTVRNTANLIANINNGIMVGQNFGNINHESGCHTDEQRFAKCTKALWVTDPDVDRDYVVNTKGSPVTGTCDWLWRDETFSEWLNGSSSKTLWIAGGPGKGKTMISVHITALLEKRCNVRNQVFAYFFCDHRDTNRNSACAILRTLIHQIIDQKRGLHSKVYPYVREDRRAEATMQSRDALWRIVTELLHEQELEGLVYLIDGLDECDDGTARWLAQKLSNLHTDSPNKCMRNVRILVASRNITSMNFSSKIDLDTIQDPGYNESIARFIDARVAEMATQVPGCTRALQDQVKRILQSRSGNSFLWIGCVMDELTIKETPTEIESSIAEFPTGLRPLYNRLLHQEHLFESSAEDDAEIRLFFGQADEVHHQIAHTCLDYLYNNLSDKEYWFCDDEDTNTRLPLLSYATIYWPTHARLIKAESEGLAMDLLDSRADTFFKQGGMAFTSWWWSSQMVRSPSMKRELPAQFGDPEKGPSLKERETIHPTHLSAALGVLPWMVYFSTFPDVPRSIVVNLFVNPAGQSLLNYAAHGGHENVVIWLCDRGATVDDRSVFAAAIEGHAGVLKALLDRGGRPKVRAYNPSTKKYENETALWDACGQGLEDVAHVLLDAGADPDELNPAPPNLIEMLLKREVDMTMSLHIAAKHGSLRAAKLLIANGVEINGTDEQGKTPLIVAAESGFAEVLELLLKNGASAEIADRDGNDARMSAEAKGHAHVVRVIDECAVKMEK
ncbi:hypothetical protein J4E93_008708 [Alternaria ventricosa]|uniref:uncharacterized protein n=1 Tax=Alternaria ventricosa TaxID=1187951 RepID=UPI0020C5A01C|nr:uncharacterized protein J4E93_008708 [Alternaria ventricosa]KAI4639909.1 hypothetical protein J4E93_008708 [Alternaria ventricosa]